MSADIGSLGPEVFESENGIKFTTDDIKPGVIFDTIAETGCRVADPANIEVMPAWPGSRKRSKPHFVFDAIDSGSLLCSFDSRMITRLGDSA